MIPNLHKTTTTTKLQCLSYRSLSVCAEDTLTPQRSVFSLTEAKGQIQYSDKNGQF